VTESVSVESEVIVRGLWWKYRASKAWVLKDINLEVKSGEILGIMGPSGAGKTTLGLTLNGLIPQTIEGEVKGIIQVAGMSTFGSPVSDLVKKVGMVFQDPETQFVTMAVQDEISFGLENMAVPRDVMIQRVKSVAKTLRIEDLLRKHPYELSGGQKQRVAIGSALALQPRILVLDEPTSDLDPIGKSEIFSLIGELREQGITMIVIEHEAEELAKFADRLILLENGSVKFGGDPYSFFSRVDELKRVGITPPQVTEFFKLSKERNHDSSVLPLTVEDGSRSIRQLLQRTTKGTNKQVFSPSEAKRGAKKDKAIIVTEGLECTYPDGTQAVRGVDVIIHPGEYVALIGQNGSGKTTLAKIWANILKPTKGRVLIDGVDSRELTQAQVASKVGYSFQNPDHQLVCDTVEKEVMFAPTNLGVPFDEAQRRADEVLATLGLSEVKAEHPFFLPKGQRTRLAVASVLSMKPQVLVVDEPTTGQDWNLAKALMNFCDGLNRAGSTIIIITHNMRVVAEHCSRTIAMHRGKIVMDGPTDEVFSQPELLEKMFLKSPMITRLAQACGEYGFPPNILTIEEMYDTFEKLTKQKTSGVI
jgi:energy-coupling factor transport system ATP-binding protein